MQRTARALVILIGIPCTSIHCAYPATVFAQKPVERIECSGTVVDERGRPVSDAEVVCSEQLYAYAEGRIVWRTPSRTTTGQDGSFRVQVGAERKDYVWVVAWKKGLSLGWQWLRGAGSGENLTVRLGKPAVLAGVVVDESGNPVAGATVRPCLKMDWMGGSVGVRFDKPRDWFAVRTDKQGRFQFDNIPAAASADFWVEAPGRASCWTYWEKELSDSAGSQFKAGQTDVRIVVKPEAILQGRIIDEENGKGVAGVLLLARPNARYANYSCVDPITSGPDGAFVYRGLAANDYSLQIVAPQDRTADWTGKDVRVTTVAGQITDVNIPVSKGGLIEVVILDAATEKPIENARASVRQQANFGLHPCWYHSAYTDAEGLARLRAPAGECHLVTWADAYTYFSDPEPAIVAKGEMLRRQVRLDAYPVVTGTVHDPEGRPAAGVIVSSKPVCEEPIRTDEHGRFRVTWRPSSSIRNVLVLARDPDRNLAGLADVKDQSQPVDVTLAPAFVVRGLITDPNDEPIPQATISLRAFMPGWVTDAASAVPTDANGVYEARGIPVPREGFTYRLEVEAQGYGPIEVRISSFEAARDRQVIVETITLPVADKSISGVVVDANGAPAPGLPIFISGPRGSDTAGQPSRRTVSDEQGRFSVDGVCAGPLRIQASFSSSPGGAGFLDAQGGDRDVKVVLGREGVHVEYVSLLGKPLPDLKGLIDIDPSQTEGRPLLICFFDMEQRPSRRCLEILAKRAAQLEQKGVIVAAVQSAAVDENALKAWLTKRAIRFPVGRMEGDIDKMKSAWGVQALPWLILTDTAHVVVAEGFPLEELDEKLADMAQAASGSVVALCTIRDPNDRPLVNAPVTVYPMAREYRTDGEGHVSVRYPRPENPDGLRVYVRHKTPAWLRATRLPSAGGEVEVRLAEALSVRGRVTDPQGNPARGVQIAALPMSNRHVRTDANGFFDIAWDPSWAGGTRDLCLMARDADRNLAALVGITPETRSVDLVLEPGLTLAGTVEDPNAKRIAHATVGLSLVRDWGCGTPVEPVESDSRGRWQITALPQRQEYHVSARVRGYGPGKATSGRINTTGDVAPVDPIILKPRNRSVSGVVIDVNGLPVEGARVVVDGEGQPDQETTTDHQGRFTMTEICDGTFALYAARDRDRHRESSGQILDVQPGRTSQEIVMFPERKRQVARDESPFEVDPQVGVLKYRWSDRGWRLLEGKDWQRIRMGTDRPRGVKLANPGHGAPLWGKWCSPAVRRGSRWIVLARAHARGQYDRLLMDTDGDGRLDDETVVAAHASSQPSEHNYLTAFGPIEVILDQSSGPPVVHLSFGFYGSDRELCVGSVGWYEGDVSVAGEKMRCLLADKNADGTFATRSCDLALADLMGLGDAERRTAHVLGKYVAVGDGFYEVRIVAEGREHVRVDFVRAAGVSCGLIRVPEGITELTVAGENGCFKLCPSEGVVRLPAGTYQIIRWRTERADMQGRRWTLTGHSFDESARVEVALDGETSLTVGEPVLTSLEQIGGTASPYSFHDPKLTGRLGETVDLDCDAAAARLSLRIRADDRSYDRTFTFEYG